MWFLVLSLDRLFCFYRHFDAFSVLEALFQFKTEHFYASNRFDAQMCLIHFTIAWTSDKSFRCPFFCLTNQNGAFCNYREGKCLDRKAYVLRFTFYIYINVCVHIFKVRIDHPLRLVGHSPNCSRKQWASIDLCAPI